MSADPLLQVDDVAHVIQIALTPVFLLSGIGTLLNVFNTRLGRVSDHTEHAADLAREASGIQAPRLLRHLRRLLLRRVMLDLSVILAAFGAAATCGAAFVLFLGGLRDQQSAFWLFGLFGGALGCTVAALIAFLTDTLLAWHGLRRDGPMPKTQALTTQPGG